MKSLWVLWYVCAVTALHAQPARHILQGRILERGSGSPLAAVSVFAHEAETRTVTDASGYFALGPLGPGRHHIHVERLGYKAVTRYVVLPMAADSIWLVELTPTSIELSQVVVEHSLSRADIRRQTLDITGLDASDLDRYKEVALATSLTRIPGVQVIQTGVSVARPVIRGLNGSRILVQDLGMKQEGQQWGSDHGLEIDGYGVGKMEIIKGPGTLQFGPEAMGGVVHILPPSVPEEGMRGTWHNTARSANDLLGSSLMLEGNRKGKFFRARVTSQQYGDYRVPAESFTYLRRVLPIHDGRLKNTAGKELHGALTLGVAGHRGSLKWTTSAYTQEAGLFPGIVGIPTGFNLRPDGNSRNVDLPRFELSHFKSAVNAVILRPRGWLQVDAGIQQNTRREMIAPRQEGYAPRPDSEEALSLRLRSSQATLRWHGKSDGNWKIIPGAMVQVMQHRRGGYDVLLPDYVQWNAGAFLTAEYQPNERSVWTGGLRYDAGNFSSNPVSVPLWIAPSVTDGFQERLVRTNQSYGAVSAGAGVSLSPSEELNVKFHLGKSFRPPNPAERTINGVHHGTFRHEQGDAGLRSEHGYQADVSVAFETGNLLIKCSPYFNFFEGYIYLRPAAYFSDLPDGGQVYRYSQHDAVFTGADVLLEFHPLDPLHLELSGDYVYTYNLETGLALPFTPPLRLQSQASWEWKQPAGIKRVQRADFGVRAVWIADQLRTDRNEKATEGYTLTEVSAGAVVRLGNQSLDIRLVCSNVFDVRYMNHLSVYRQLNLPEQGRNLTMVIKIPFNIQKKSTQ